MKRLFSGQGRRGAALTLLLLSLLAGRWAQAQGPTFQWAVTCGVGVGSPSSGVSITKLVVDAQGNTYAAGSFGGTVTIGSTSITSNGPSDILVTKLDAQGNYLWVSTAGGTSYEGPSSISLDGVGGVYVGGSFASYSITFGSGGATVYNSSADQDAFIAKLDATTGQWQWARRAGGTSTDIVRALTVNDLGEVCIAGEFSSGTADFGPTVLIGSPTSGGRYRQDVFVAKLTSGGQWLWAVRGGGGLAGRSAANLVSDATGALYLAGTIAGEVPFTSSFGASTLVGNYTGNQVTSASDGFVAKLNASGAWQWAVQGDAAGTNLAKINDLAIDRQGNLYVGGEYAGNAARIGATILPNQGRQLPPLSQAPSNPPVYYNSSCGVGEA